MNEFIEKILETLRSNGFPHKRVSLPTDKMYEAADKRGLSFNKALEELKTQHSVEAEIGPDKIIFSRPSQEDMIKQAQEMMAQMNPEELKQMQEMFMNMTPEQKEELMKKGRDLGLL
jgi:antitoxin component of MazEF toxin-antitoxin module